MIPKNIDENTIKDFVSGLKSEKIDINEQLPKISIVVPAYNHAHFLERTLLSIINQNYANTEIIVIDGGSKDNTIEVIEKYQNYISFWVSEPDKGQSDALNKGFARATGDIYGWLNSDDIYYPNVFNVAVENFLKYPSKKVVYGDFLNIDENDAITDYVFAFDMSINHLLYEGFFMNAQSMFWRKTVHQNFGSFDVSLSRSMDYDMIVRFGLKEGNDSFLRINDTFFGCFRVHEAQKTQNFDSEVLKEQEANAIKYGIPHKFKQKGKFLRFLFRFRRMYWYVKRGGFTYCGQQILKMLG